MPSQLHEVLLQLFRNRPLLAPELLHEALHQELPPFTEARIDSAELNEVQPTEYRADLVVLLLNGKPVFGIVVEVQLSPDDRKQYVWPVYVTGLRARIECPVCLLVITADEACARWAAKRIYIGGESHLTPVVLGPSGIPEITDDDVAIAHPELAVLSAMAHGEDEDTEKSVRIAAAAQRACMNLDEGRSKLYRDLIFVFLSKVARRALQAMSMSKHDYENDLGMMFYKHGQEEGSRQGRAELVARQLTVRYGELGEEVRARLTELSLSQLDAIGERLLTAKTLEEALG